jgi:hypothetical protein
VDSLLNGNLAALFRHAQSGDLSLVLGLLVVVTAIANSTGKVQGAGANLVVCNIRATPSHYLCGLGTSTKVGVMSWM